MSIISQTHIEKKSIFISSSAIFIAILMAMIDTGIANIALPTISLEFSTSEANSIWVVTAYLLAMVACTLPMASLGEVYGHRRIFIIGLILFIIASFFCGKAWSLQSLIIARVFQGVGASCLLSTNLALIRHIFPPSRLGVGLGLNSICMGLGFSIGSTLSSLIIYYISWHWLFLINVPIGLICLFLAIRYLPTTPFSTYRYDILAAILCAIVFSAFVFAIGQAAHESTLIFIIIPLAISFFALLYLLWQQRGHPAPFLAFDLFGYRIFSLSILAVLCVFLAQGIAFVALPFSFFSLLKGSQLEIGFLIAPWPIMAASTSFLSGRLSDRVRPAILVCFGLTLSAFAMLGLSMVHYESSKWLIACLMMFCGIGIGFFNAPNQHIVMFSTPRERSGAAGAIMGLARLLGQSIGSALVAFFLIKYSTIGTQYALWLGVVFYVIAIFVSSLRIIQPKTP